MYRAHPAGPLRLHSLTTIGSDAFSRTAITSFKLPKSIKTLAGFDQTALTGELDLSIYPDLTTIDYSAFRETNITSLKLPDSLQTIGNNAFFYCTALTRLDLTGCGALASVASDAFRSCTALIQVFAALTDQNTNDVLLRVLAALPAPPATVEAHAGEQGEIYLSADLLRELADGAVDLTLADRGQRVTFTPDPAAAVTGAAPLNTLAGPAYIDAQGAVYLLDDENHTASLAYLPRGLVSYTVPASITAPDDAGTSQTYNVTAVSSRAPTLARTLASLTFEAPEKVTLADYALSCPSLRQVNGETTVDAAAALFANKNADAFLGTGLIAGTDTDRLSPSTSLTLSSPDGDATLALNVRVPTPYYREEKGVWITGTGKQLSLTLSVSGGNVNAYHYRLCLLASGGDLDLGGLGMAEDTTYTDEATGVQYTLRRGTAPGLFYVDITVPNIGTTWSRQFSLQYPAGTAGGSLVAWLEMGEQALPAPAGQYYQFAWETEPAPYTASLSQSGSTFSYTRTAPGAPAILKTGLEWTSTVTPGERTTYQSYFALATDPVRVVEHQFTLTLPEGLAWRQEILAALTSGQDVPLDVSSSGLSLGGAPLLAFSSLTTNTAVTAAAAARLNSDGTLTLVARQAATSADLTDTVTASFTLDPAAVVVENENTFNFNEEKEISVTAKPRVEYAFSPAASAGSNMVQWTSTAPASALTFDKESSEAYFDYRDGYYFTLTAQNATIFDLPLQSISDPLPTALFMTPAQIAQLFTLDEAGLSNRQLAQHLTLTIQDARVYQYHDDNALGQVTLTDGATQITLTADKTDEYDTLVETKNVTITLKTTGDLSVQIGDAGAEQVAPDQLESYFTRKGVTAAANTQYIVTWQFPADHKLQSGETYTLRVPARPKDTFQQLTADNITYRGASVSSSPSNFSNGRMSVTNRASLQELSSSPSTANARIYYYRDCAIGKSLAATEATSGQVLDYTVTVYQNDYSQTTVGLPVVDVLSGAQVLLAPASDNQGQSWAGGAARYTDGDGNEYYKLELPASAQEQGRYTYQGVWLGGYYADSVTVIRYNALTDEEKAKYNHPGYENLEPAFVQDGYVTEIRWYLAPAAASLSVTRRNLVYQALADADYAVAGAPGAGWLNNIAYLNDRAGDRLFSVSGVLPLRTFESAKELLDENGRPAGTASTISAGDTVHYRLTIKNNTASKRTATGLEDRLPDTGSVFQWDQTNVKVSYAYAGGGSSLVTFPWQLADGEITWPEGVTIPAGSTLYIYVDLTFPVGQAWQNYCAAIGGGALSNVFRLGNESHTVTHALALPAAAYLQKGVRETRVKSSNPYTDTYVESADLRRFPEEIPTAYTGVAFYALVYNQGPGPLYLTELQDRITSQGASGKILHETNTSSAVAPALITDPGELENLPAGAQLVEAAITAQTRQDAQGDLRVFRFAPSEKYDDMDTIAYDAAGGAYYLAPGQALAFTYTARVTGAPDAALNTLAMPLYDPYDAGASLAEEVGQVKNDYDMSGKTGNDGGCGQWTEYQATQLQGFATSYHADLWLYSQVSLARADTVPGLEKAVVQKRSSGGDITSCEGFAGPLDAVRWQLTVSNDGENLLNGYTITDTLPPYYTLATGEVVLTGALDGAPFPATLFTVKDYTMGDDGRVTSVTTSDGTVTVGGAAMERSAYSLKLWYNDDGRLVMELTLKQKNLSGYMYYAVKPGATSKLTYWTENYTTTQAYTSFVNTAVLTLPEQEIEYDRVTTGRVLRDDAGQGTGIQARATVTITANYSTSSSKSVTEQGVPDNTTNSLAGGAIALSPATDKNGYTGFTYQLEVANTTANTQGIQWLTLIDNLPEPDDVLTLNGADPRYSDFKVEFQADPNVRVWYEDKSGTEHELTDQANIQYSAKTSFASEDWGSYAADTPTPPAQDGWGAFSADARSIRVYLSDPDIIIPANATLYVSFDCQVADPAAEPGEIAWNSFGYRYQMKNDFMHLEAAPLEVGVMIPDYPRIQKTLVDEDGEAAVAAVADTFRFLIYTGEGLAGNYTTGRDLVEALVADNRQFSLATIDFAVGDDEHTLKLGDLRRYEYDQTDRVLKETTDPWVWTNGAKYTMVELADEPFAWLGSYWDYDFYRLNNSTTNSYTFVYNKAASQLAHFENMNVSRELDLLKVDAADAGLTLPGAIFGLYSESAADALTGQALEAECQKHGLTAEQQAALAGKATITLGTGQDEKTYYLCRLGKTNDYGLVFWDELEGRNYCYQELWAPAGYQITDQQPVAVTFDKNGHYIRQIENTVQNDKLYLLPKTGGMGRWQLPALGMALCTLAVLALAKKRRKV